MLGHSHQDLKQILKHTGGVDPRFFVISCFIDAHLINLSKLCDAAHHLSMVCYRKEEPTFLLYRNWRKVSIDVVVAAVGAI